MRALTSRYTTLCLAIVFSGVVLLLAGCDWLPGPGDGGPPSTIPADLRPAFQQPGQWVFAESAALTCRDGSSTGIGVRLQEGDTPGRPGGPFNLDNYSDDLVIFLEGGGACFNFPTCSQNRSSFSADEFFSADFIGGYSGLFDAANPDNPVADWNAVYVPYCTGDEHAGSTLEGTVPAVTLDFDGDDNPEVDLPGLSGQQFAGYDNVGRVLAYLGEHLDKDYDRILLTGSSAGGVGALANYRQVADAYPEVDVTLLNDSGPIFYDDTILPVALQELWRQTWDLSEALPSGTEDETDVLETIYGAIAADYPDASLGFVSTEQDFTIRFFYSFGQALTPTPCAAQLYGGLGMTPPQRVACIGAEAYEDALYALRGELPAGWTTFYTAEPDPELHTFLRAERFYGANAEGQTLADWTKDLIEGRAEDKGSR
jgi:hypothetical protein